MDDQKYRDVYKKYLELWPKVMGVARITEKHGEYEVVDGNVHNEFIRIRNELEHYLDFLSNEELLAIVTDPGIGPKAGAILDKIIKK